MKNFYEILLQETVTVYTEDWKCPAQWQGSGIYDKKSTELHSYRATVCAETEDEAIGEALREAGTRCEGCVQAVQWRLLEEVPDTQESGLYDMSETRATSLGQLAGHASARLHLIVQP